MSTRGHGRASESSYRGSSSAMSLAEAATSRAMDSAMSSAPAPLEPGGRAEWFEVTEVFEGVEARDIEAFMQCRNGIATRQGFDSDTFLDGLDLGTPSRAAQRRAADKVIAAVGKKLGKGSYRDMEKMHGYGTLIVGLPLWFASYPANPLRAENVIDDFVSRVGMGLKPHFRRLGNRRCPFWRIVVVWKTSAQSMREWTSRARFDVYDDPALRDLGAVPARIRISGIFVGRHAAWRIEAICLWGAAGEVGKARPAAAKDGTDFAEAGGRGNASPSANSSTDQVAHSAAVRGTGLFRARSRLGRSRTLDRRETVAPPLDRAYGCEATGKKALSGQLPASRGTATSAGRAQEQPQPLMTGTSGQRLVPGAALGIVVLGVHGGGGHGGPGLPVVSEAAVELVLAWQTS